MGQTTHDGGTVWRSLAPGAAAYQRYFYRGRYIGADITNPRFDRYAELFGAGGYYVDDPDQIGDVVRTALRSERPAVVEIPIDPDELPAPATMARRGE